MLQLWIYLRLYSKARYNDHFLFHIWIAREIWINVQVLKSKNWWKQKCLHYLVISKFIRVEKFIAPIILVVFIIYLIRFCPVFFVAEIFHLCFIWLLKMDSEWFFFPAFYFLLFIDFLLHRNREYSCVHIYLCVCVCVYRAFVRVNIIIEQQRRRSINFLRLVIRQIKAFSKVCCKEWLPIQLSPDANSQETRRKAKRKNTKKEKHHHRKCL